MRRDFVRSEYRDDNNRREVDPEDGREIFRILLEIPYIHQYNPDKCEDHDNDHDIDSEENEIHEKEVKTACRLFIFTRKSRFVSILES